MMKSNQRGAGGVSTASREGGKGEGGREEDNWDECELYPKSDELLSKFLSSSLCFIQMPPKTLKIVWTEPSHVRFKERSKLLASVKVYNELKTVWDLKGSSNKNQTVTVTTE